MATNFSIGDDVIPNQAYIEQTLSKRATTPQQRQTVGSLRSLIGIPCEILDIGQTPNLTRFVKLLPSDTKISAYKGGRGIAIYFSSDAACNNSLEKSTAFLRDKCFVKVLNSSGSTITKLQLLRQVGFDTATQLPTVGLADATTVANAVVLGVAMEDIEDGAMGAVLTDGSYQTDTSSFSIGAQVFVSDTPGAIAITAGTESVICGRVLEVATEGAISFFSTLTGGGSGSSGDVNPPDVSQLEAEAGTLPDMRLWSPERVSQAITALAPSAPVNNFGIGAVGEIAGAANTTVPPGSYVATGLFADPIDNQDQTRVIGGSGSVRVDPGFGVAGDRGGLILGKGLRLDRGGRLTALVEPNSNTQVRAFWGFAAQGSSLANILIDAPLVKHIGLQYSQARGDSTWQVSRRQTSQSLTNTGFNYQSGLNGFFVVDCLPNGNSAEYSIRFRIFDFNAMLAGQWAGTGWPTPTFDQTFIYSDQVPTGDMSVFFAIEMLTSSKPIIGAAGFSFQDWAHFSSFPV
jgi:hypothetical protein